MKFNSLPKVKSAAWPSDSSFWVPRERQVVGLIPSRNKPKSLKLVEVAFPFGAQDYGKSTMTCSPVSE